MGFSKRIPRDLSHNLLGEAQEKAAGKGILDLTLSNPTLAGFDYSPNLWGALGKAESSTYKPSPFGSWEARQQVADYWTKTRGRPTSPERVVLTASTSEAYSYLFKLLGNAGDSVLIPTPGYPLLEYLARLEELIPLPYRFLKAPGWPLDLGSVEKAIQDRTQALLVVNPNNPTGAFLTSNDQKKLEDLCRERRLAYLSDEVFAEYPFDLKKTAGPIDPRVLSFRLGGLSKSAGAPQLKLSWIILDGPEDLVSESLARLEWIADTYLSLNSPVQAALGDWLSFAPTFQDQLRKRMGENLALLSQELGSLKSLRLWTPQGGWTVLLELLACEGQEEAWVLELLQDQGVLVHPGGLYDFTEGAFMVLSLLPSPEIWKNGVQKLKSFLEKKEKTSRNS